MDKDKITTIHSVYGDAQDMTSRLSEVLSILKFPIVSSQEKDETEILYHLRRIVEKCDNISNTLERTFAQEMPKE